MMLQAIAVDDEKRALERFGRVIQGVEGIALRGSFIDPQGAIEYLQKENVDIAFLDIEMPGINGLEFAGQLLVVQPNLEIIFVTAYDKYALQAFQAQAIGYLLKPVELGEIQKQVANILRRKTNMSQKPDGAALIAECFGQFLCYPGHPDQPNVRWRTQKAEELFALLLHFQGKPVAREIIMDTLWPQMDREKAAQNLYSTCHYIREALQDNGFQAVFVRTRGGYQLMCDKLHCDLLTFTQVIGDMRKGLATLEMMEAASALYKGAYFDDRPYEWAVKTRAYFESEYCSLQFKLQEYYVAHGEPAKACTALKQVIYHNALVEEAYIRLIGLQIQLQDPASAVIVYQQYEQILMQELALKPPEHLRCMMAELFSEK